MEIEDSKVDSWAFTLRKTTTKRGVPTEEDYHNHLAKISRSTTCFVREYVFEQTKGLHMHGVLEMHRTVNMKYFRVRGWKLHLERIWNLDGWQRYIMKEQLIKDSLSVPPLKKSLFLKYNKENASVSDTNSESAVSDETWIESGESLCGSDQETSCDINSES